MLQQLHQSQPTHDRSGCSTDVCRHITKSQGQPAPGPNRPQPCAGAGKIECAAGKRHGEFLDNPATTHTLMQVIQREERRLPTRELRGVHLILVRAMGRRNCHSFVKQHTRSMKGEQTLQPGSTFSIQGPRVLFRFQMPHRGRMILIREWICLPVSRLTTIADRLLHR